MTLSVNDTQQNDAQHNETQLNDTQLTGSMKKQNATLSMIALETVSFMLCFI
jgi:hypothetical protein